MAKPVVRMWLAEPPPPEVKQALQRLERLDDLVRMAIMPDVHLGEQVCIGCVLATRQLIYPAAVGADIGCGIAALPLSSSPVDRADPHWLRKALARAVPIMRHARLSDAPEMKDRLDPAHLSCRELAQTARHEGRVELGTLGRGNHFLEVQGDADGRLWLMVHSGSRAMGQAISRLHLRNAQRGRGGIEFLEASTPAGQAYLNDARWAVHYAQANRRLMLDAAAVALKEELGDAEWNAHLDTNHNHVQVETHFGQPLLVHRKGAAPAHAGENGLIPGCMGGESFHVIGRGVDEALCSSSHGAGRAMSRAEARRRIGREELLDQIRDARLANALREEAPRAYKDIRVVMRAQRDLVKIQRVVRGIATYKGS